jgi:hypothetical protein
LRLSHDLEQVLLRQVAALLQAVADEENVEQMASRLLDASASLAVGAAREVVASVALRLFDVATGGLGPQLVERLRPLRDEFLSRGASAAADEVAEFLRPNPLDVLVGFLRVAVELSDHPLTLRVDEAQNVDERGLRLLADLAMELPQGVRLMVAWRTTTEDERASLSRLKQLAPAIDYRELEPLTAAELTQWLAAAQAIGVDPREMLARTAGSPLVVSDALRQGLPSSEQQAVAELVGRAVSNLDESAASALFKLAVLSRRPPPHVLSALTGLSACEILSVDEQLLDAGLVSGRAEDGPWLHELRRQAVLGLMTDERVRAETSRAAADALAGLAVSDDSWQPEQLRLVREARPTYDPDELEVVLLDLSWDRIALLAAHLELAAVDHPAVVVDPLLRYAREVWEARGDLVRELELLTQEGLLEMDDDSQRVHRESWPAGAIALLCARCLEQLGRRPLADLAGSVVAVGLGRHLSGASGYFTRVGPADAHSLVRLAHAVLPGESREHLRPTLLAEVDFRDVPMPLVAWFDDAGRCTDALANLQGLTQPLFGKRLRVRSVTTLPGGPVPTERFMRSLEVALGVPRGGVDDVREASPAMSIDEYMNRRLQTLELLWELGSAPERAAMELDERIALAWTVLEEWFWEAEIHGGRRGVHPLPLSEQIQLGPLISFRLVETLALSPAERALGPRGQTPPPGHDLPEVDAVEHVLERAAAYNGTLPPRTVTIEPVALSQQLREALVRDWDSAASLRARLNLPAPAAPTFRLALTVLLPAAKDSSGLWARGVPWCVYAWERSDVIDARVAMIEGLSGGGDGDELEQVDQVLAGQGVSRGPKVDSFGIAEAQSFLAEILGYRATDVVLRWSRQ